MAKSGVIRAPKVVDVAVPEAFVRDAEFGRVAVSLAFVDRVAIVDVGKADDPALHDLDDRDRPFVGIQQDLADARLGERRALGLELREEPGRGRLGAGEGECRQLVAEGTGEREPRGLEGREIVTDRSAATRRASRAAQEAAPSVRASLASTLSAAVFGTSRRAIASPSALSSASRGSSVPRPSLLFLDRGQPFGVGRDVLGGRAQVVLQLGHVSLLWTARPSPRPNGRLDRRTRW